MKKLLIAGTALSALTLVAAAALFVAPAGAGGFFGRHAGPFGHHGFGRGEAPDPEHVREHLREMTARALGEVGASDEQIDQVVAILASTGDDLHALRDAHRAQRDTFAALLAAPQVDRGALDALRAEGIATADAASSRIVGALADAADVLSAEQREALGDFHESFHGHFRRGGR